MGVCYWHRTKLRSPTQNGKVFSLLSNTMFWGRKARKVPFPATCTTIKKKGSIPVLPADRNFFLPAPNLNQEVAGRVSMMWFPVVGFGFRKIPAISWTGSKWFALAAEVTLGMFLRTGLHQPESATALTPFPLVSRKKMRRQRKKVKNKTLKLQELNHQSFIIKSFRETLVLRMGKGFDKFESY